MVYPALACDPPRRFERRVFLCLGVGERYDALEKRLYTLDALRNEEVWIDERGEIDMLWLSGTAQGFSGLADAINEQCPDGVGKPALPPTPVPDANTD